jgi:hypothetical protein
MPTDPFAARRTGAHRLRVVTASIGAAAVVGTGALAWSIAATTASAATGSTTEDGEVPDTGSTTTTDDDQFLVPSQLPQSSTSGHGPHASSGGS